MSEHEHETPTAELVDAWEEWQARLEDARAAYERAEHAETGAKVTLHDRLLRLGVDHAHVQAGRCYWVESNQVRVLRLIDLADPTS